MSSSKSSSSIKIIKKVNSSFKNNSKVETVHNIKKDFEFKLVGENHSSEFISPNIIDALRFEFSKEDINKAVHLIKTISADKELGYYGLHEVLRAIHFGGRMRSNRNPFRGNRDLLARLRGKNAIIGDLFTLNKVKGANEIIPTPLGKVVSYIHHALPYLPYKEDDFNTIFEELEKDSSIAYQLRVERNFFSKIFTGKILNKPYLCFSTLDDMMGINRLVIKKGTVKSVIFSPNFETVAKINRLDSSKNSEFNTIDNPSVKKAFAESANKQILSLLDGKTVEAKPALLYGNYSELVLTGATKENDANNEPFYVIVSSHKVSNILEMTGKKFGDVEFRIGNKDLNIENKIGYDKGYMHYPLVMIDKKTKDIIAITQEDNLHVQQKNEFFDKEDPSEIQYGVKNWAAHRVAECLLMYKKYGLIDI